MKTSILPSWLAIMLCLLTSLQSAGQTSDSLLAQLSRKWINAKSYTLKMAVLMPAEHYDTKPVPDIFSFKQQLLHTAENIKWLSSTYLFTDGDKQPEDSAKMDKAAIIKYLANAYDQGLSAHYKLTTKQLDEVVPFFAGPKTRRQILLLMHDHQTHHVGQLIIYLRLQGIKPPAYIGW